MGGRYLSTKISIKQIEFERTDNVSSVNECQKAYDD